MNPCKKWEDCISQRKRLQELTGEKNEGLCNSSVGRVEVKKDPTQAHHQVLCPMRKKESPKPGSTWKLGIIWHLPRVGDWD